MYSYNIKYHLIYYEHFSIPVKLQSVIFSDNIAFYSDIIPKFT